MDVIFAIYAKNSIKKAERLKRARSRTITFQQLREDHPITQWNKFVNKGHNKSEIVKLLVQLLSRNEILLTSDPGTFFVTSREQCYKIWRNGSKIVTELESSQEADDDDSCNACERKWIWYCNYTKSDAGVFVICLSFLHRVTGSIFFKTWEKDKASLLDFNKVEKKSLGKISAPRQWNFFISIAWNICVHRMWLFSSQLK